MPLPTYMISINLKSEINGVIIDPFGSVCQFLPNNAMHNPVKLQYGQRG